MKNKKTSIDRLLKKSILPVLSIFALFFTVTTITLLYEHTMHIKESSQVNLVNAIEQKMKEMISTNYLILDNIKRLKQDEILDKDKMNNYLQEQLERYELLTSIRIIDKNGIIINAPESEKSIIGFDEAYKDYFLSSKNRNEIFVSKTFIPFDKKEAIIAMAITTEDKGVIVGYCSLREIQKLVEELRDNDRNEIAILDSNGVFVINTNYSKVLTKERETNYEQLKVKGDYVLNYNNKKYNVISRPIDNSALTLIIYKPYYDDITVFLHLFYLGILFVVLIMGFGVYYISAKLSNPILKSINSFMKKTEEIKKGNYLIDMEQSNILEINSLEESFSAMAKELNEMIKQLSDSQAELEGLNEDLVYQNEMMKHKDEQVSLIINNLYDGILVLDEKFNVLWVNKAVYELFEIDSSKPDTNIKCYDLIYNFDAKCYFCDMEVVKLTKEKLTKTVSHFNKLIEETYIPNFDENGKFVGVVKTFRDVTEKAALESKLNRSIKMEAIGRLTGGIAHDFNNILQVIIGYSDLLMNQLEQVDNNGNMMLKMHTIYDAATKAEQLIKKLMTFSKIEQISPKNISLNVVVRELGSMLSRIIGEDIVISFRLEDFLPEIFADPTQMEQIIMNLCINAKHAMLKGGSIDIHTYSTKKNDITYSVLEISDTGTGIPESIIEKIYDPFFTTKEIGKGTGLGLAIVLGIVEKHHGFIELQTEIGKGTCFSIYFPESKTKEDGYIKPKISYDDSKLSGINILLAEDDDSVRNIAAFVLKSKGVNLIRAVDGRDAIKQYMDFEGEIQVLILDVIMPGINGVEVYEKINELNPKTKVIFTTGYSSDFLGEDYNLSPQGRILHKPYKNEELIIAILEVLEEE